MSLSELPASVHQQRALASTRREFLRRSPLALAGLALAGLPLGGAAAAEARRPANANPLAPKTPPRPAKARRVIYLSMSGSPPQHDLFDYKPKLNELNLQPCPNSLLENQRFAFIKGHPKLLGTPHKFARRGESGTWMSDIMPHLAEQIDQLCVVKSMHTDQFNHAPAELLLYTGSARAGGAAMGSWTTYGLGSENEDLPGFVVMVSGGTDPSGGKSLWGSGFLPGIYQGVQCRTSGDPILYVNNPAGMDTALRRRSLDALRQLNELELAEFGDPETLTRIGQYELAYRMQMSVPEVMSLSDEPQHVLKAYGAEPGQASFANNCLLARRLLEKGVRFVQLFDWGWDMHGTGESNDLVTGLPRKCREVDQPIAALLADLRQRGLLDDTLVIWGGEFGRTSMNEERNGSKFFGRDHHPHCFTMWLAGGGVKPGTSYGETDEFGYFIAENPVSVQDLQTTILHLLGLDAFRLSYPYQGLNQRLIGVEGHCRVVRELLA